MIKIADNLKGEALLLWELATLFDLEPEELAPYVGVSVDRIHEWFGGQAPTEDEKAKIHAAQDKIEAANPEPAVRLRGSAEKSGAWWGKHKPTAEEKAEHEFFDRMTTALATLKKMAAEDPALVDDLNAIEACNRGNPSAWYCFEEIYRLVVKLGIKV